MNEFHDVRNVYIVRHCQPIIKNGIHICIGKKDISLSKRGKEQAGQLADYFSNRHINHIYSSHLKRAKETAQLIAGNNYEVVTKDNFSELDVGKWDGLTFHEIKQKYPEEYEERGKDLENYVVEGGESMALCRTRAMDELNKTIDESKGDILIVTHAGVIRTILSSILDISIKETFDYKIEYGSISLLNINEKKLSLKKIGIIDYREI